MRTRHFFIFTLALLFCLPVVVTAQNHSIIVDMNEKGPTTPKPRSLTGFSSGAAQSSQSQAARDRDKEAPGVWIDLEKKELYVRIMQPGPDCRMQVTSDNESFVFHDSVVTGGVINVYSLSGMEKQGWYTITVQASDKCYQGDFMYDKARKAR